MDAGRQIPAPTIWGRQIFTTRPAVKRDLEFILKGAMALSIPCIIGTAGGAGACEHVRWTESIIAEIAREQVLRFRWGSSGRMEQGSGAGAMQEGRVCPLSPAPELTADEVAESVRIVARWDPNPLLQLSRTLQVVLCGRCYDP